MSYFFNNFILSALFLSHKILTEAAEHFKLHWNVLLISIFKSLWSFKRRCKKEKNLLKKGREI